ncbi:hypothetical protein MRX96_015226 [Rhipicephalus microplus]
MDEPPPASARPTSAGGRSSHRRASRRGDRLCGAMARLTAFSRRGNFPQLAWTLGDAGPSVAITSQRIDGRNALCVLRRSRRGRAMHSLGNAALRRSTRDRAGGASEPVPHHWG